ncbi:MAG: hypothetical protein LBU64_08120 [Planctomycetota bacterium]|nr:hypothetical protein [Planctomycetota bacterium]
MGKMILGVAAMFLASASVSPGGEICPPPVVEKWVEVCETVQVEIPVVEYVDTPCEIKVTRMCPVEKEVPVTVGKWVYEECQVPYVRRVVECEEYTDYETRYEMRPETRIRKVPQIVCEEEERTVVDKVAEEVCDPYTGGIKKVWREVCRTVTVPVRRKIMVEEQYTVNVKCPVKVPITRTRKVIKEVPDTRTVSRRKYVSETKTKTVTVMEPRFEISTVMRKKAVKTTKMVEKQVVKRVKVKAEPDCPPVPVCP